LALIRKELDMPVTGGENAVEDATVTRCRRQVAQQLRVDSVRTSAAAGLAHPASWMSAAELMPVLLDGHLRLDFCDPQDPCRDHLIFSQGRSYADLTSAESRAAVIAECTNQHIVVS
jgi:transketolase